MTKHQQHFPGSHASHPTRSERKGLATNVSGHGEPTAMVQWRPQRSVSTQPQPAFFVYCHPEEYRRFQKEPEETPLVQVLAVDDVFWIPNGGDKGQIMRVGMHQLQEWFGKDAKQEDILRRILLEGHLEMNLDHI